MTENITVTGYTLPINLEYKEAIKVELANPAATRISNAALEFHPYFVFEYALDIARKDPVGGTHPVTDRGIHIVDALDGQFLYTLRRMDSSAPIRMVHRITNHKSTENLSLSTNEEITQIIIDLKTLKTELNHKIIMNGDYEVGIVDDELSIKMAEREVLEKVVSENTQKASYYTVNKKGKSREQKIKIIPRFSEITIRRKSLTYVPKWIITIKAGGVSYNRTILATSKTFIIDEIAECPKIHFSLGKLWTVRKKTYAICEICGGAFCAEHIFKVNSSYYCEEHRIINLVTSPSETQKSYP